MREDVVRLQEAVEASRRDAAAQVSAAEEKALAEGRRLISAAVQEAETRGQDALQNVQTALHEKEAALEVSHHSSKLSLARWETLLENSEVLLCVSVKGETQ